MEIIKKNKYENKEEFLEKTYIKCPYCGYNNKKKRFEAFGTCLHCNNIIDKKVYFKAQMVKKSIKKARTQGTYVTKMNLPF